MNSTAPGRRIEVRGTVQGVGFRPWVYQLAQRLQFKGTVKNGPAGVTIDAWGAPRILDQLLECLANELPPTAHVDTLHWEPLECTAPDGFTIIASDPMGPGRVNIPADLPLCDECRHEIHDPSARRFRYPFTNCTHCGPRFTIATSIPYDRPATTMSTFALCDECRAEYENPLDRRFHAQPIACPKCGPRLTWLDASGSTLDVADPLHLAAQQIVAGRIVALRGLGGFHLACDALDEAVVAMLRTRKHRDEKPLAVMVTDVAMAQRYGEFSSAELELLTSPARPIVVVNKRSALAPSVAPGFRQVGLFLPYTPLHELLLDEVKRPLVMTSGNRAEEPMCIDTDEAVQHLAGIADGFLTHDRPIATRADDSVARIVDGAPMVLRRARGYVPNSIASPVPFREPIVAVGGQLKNTFCIAHEGQLTLGPHVGDLELLSSQRSFETMLSTFERFLGVSPTIVAHDLHPDYDSTRYALRRPASQRIGVQHHHAHVAAVMAEHGLQGKVIGVAFDGTGFASDGTLWGGEFMLASYDSFERVGTLRTMGLAGGEKAIRDAWRLSLAVLDDAFDNAPPLEGLELFRGLPSRDLSNVRHLLHTGFRVAWAHGAGRVFDAAAALILAKRSSSFEAQLPMGLEQVAEGPGRPWPFEVDRTLTPWQIDLRPMWRALVEALRARRPPAELAANVHATLGAATADLVNFLRAQHGALPVVLAGGCFANARLAFEVTSRLDECEVYLPRQIPPGDGGLALGQAIIAASRMSTSQGAT